MERLEQSLESLLFPLLQNISQTPVTEYQYYTSNPYLNLLIAHSYQNRQ